MKPAISGPKIDPTDSLVRKSQSWTVSSNPRFLFRTYTELLRTNRFRKSSREMVLVNTLRGASRLEAEIELTELKGLKPSQDPVAKNKNFMSSLELKVLARLLVEVE